MSWNDLREWMTEVDSLGELCLVEGASWQEDIGHITEMLDHNAGAPCVLFDRIPDYEPGRRVIVNCNGTRRRQAITLGMPPEAASHHALMERWRGILNQLKPLGPETVKDGPVMENVVEGDDVDLERFPAPQWHPKDGGRFLGTASVNIMRDPDSNWVNLGTYRNQILGRRRLGIWISPGKHGRLIRGSYFERGERCPVVVVVGSDPLAYLISGIEVPFVIPALSRCAATASTRRDAAARVTSLKYWSSTGVCASAS